MIVYNVRAPLRRGLFSLEIGLDKHHGMGEGAGRHEVRRLEENEMELIIERKEPETPKGKRRIVRNVWGNTNGYVSGRFWITFGPTYAVGVEEEAQAWLKETAS